MLPLAGPDMLGPSTRLHAEVPTGSALIMLLLILLERDFVSLDDPLRHRSSSGSASGRPDACCEAPPA